jgi:serine acetyltransferase
MSLEGSVGQNLFRTLLRDAKRNDWAFESWRSIPALTMNPSVRMIGLIRLGGLARGSGLIRSFVRKWCRSELLARFGSDVSFDATIGPGLKCPHPINIVIGEGCRIGQDATIYHGTTLGRSTAERAEYPKVADNVTIYANASILGSVCIGERAIVAAHALVLDDVPAGHSARGIPARTAPTKSSA